MDKKQRKRDLFSEQKKETMEKAKKLIEQYESQYTKNNNAPCNIFNGNIELKRCIDKKEKQLWTTFVHLTTSLPYRNSVGRQVKFFVTCDNIIIGLIHMTSAMAQLKLRDKYLGWSYDEKWKDKKINTIYNVQTCVANRFQELLSCKLLVYCIFSIEMKNVLSELYNDEVKGIEITSLYGKSSVYNRIPFLHYLGLTEGMSAVSISDTDWKIALDLYNSNYAKKRGKTISKSRLAPIKFQVLNKLDEELKREGKETPYTYKLIEFQRGVYFGNDFSKTLEERINDWRTRWLFPRAKRLNYPISSI